MGCSGSATTSTDDQCNAASASNATAVVVVQADSDDVGSSTKPPPSAIGTLLHRTNRSTKGGEINSERRSAKKIGDLKTSGIALEMSHLGGPQAIETVLKAMLAHLNSKELQERGLATLWRWIETEKFDAVSAVVVVMKSMETHAEAVFVQEHGCRILVDVADHSKTNSRAQLKTLNAARVVIQAMEKHETVCIHSYGCDFVRKMATGLGERSGHLKRHMGLSGAIKTILNSMRLHRKNAVVMKYALNALSSLLPEARNQTELVDQGCVQQTLAGMAAHQQDAVLQSIACSLLGDMATESPRNQARICEVGGPQAVHRAMADHPEHVPVQKSGCQALRAMLRGRHWRLVGPSCARDERREDIMQATSGAIQAAMRNLHAVKEIQEVGRQAIHDLDSPSFAAYQSS